MAKALFVDGRAYLADGTDSTTEDTKKGGKRPLRAEAADLVTVPDVELATTGIEYQLGSGPHTFTQAELEAAVDAANNDPGVKTPRLKPGHDGPLSELVGASDQPALGVAANLRMSDDRQSIMADYVGVPKWFADVLPSVYPSRSIEGDLDVESGTGKKHALVITAVSLLGVTMPGISTIDDLKQICSAEGPELTVLAKTGDDMAKVTAAVDMEDIRRQYYDQLDAAQQWWWVRTIRLNPNELIVDDDSGDLYRVPFEVSGEDSIDFGDAVEVKVEYVDIAASSGDTPPVTAAVFASRAESRPESVNDKEEGMDPIEIRTLLGLAEDASDEDVREAIKVKNEHAPGSEEPTASPATGDSPAVEEPGEETPVETPENPVVPEGMTLVDTEALAAMQAGSKAGIEARQVQVEAHRKGILASAVKEGRIPPSREQHYASMFERDPEGTETLLTASVDEGGLAPGMIPVQEIGAGAEVTDQTSHDRVMAGAFGITKEG